jgi:hypothetical protein
MSNNYNPHTHVYELGDLIVYKGEFLSCVDEVGMIVGIVSMMHDSIDLIYEIETPSGRDIITQFDAQFILVPLEIYDEKKKKRKIMLDYLHKQDIIMVKENEKR